MIVPGHLTPGVGIHGLRHVKTATYRFMDGSVLTVGGCTGASVGDFDITTPDGAILYSTFTGEHMGPDNPNGYDDLGDIADDVAAFLGADGSKMTHHHGNVEDIRASGDNLIFPVEVARWAAEKEDELSILSSYREDKRLEEEN